MKLRFATLFVLAVPILTLSTKAWAAKDVKISKVVYVYQPDITPTDFEFYSDIPNGCGSNLYRVVSSDEKVADRKFSLVLSAFMSGKNLSFHDKEQCSGARSLVSWVRITND